MDVRSEHLLMDRAFPRSSPGRGTPGPSAAADFCLRAISINLFISAGFVGALGCLLLTFSGGTAGLVAGGLLAPLAPLALLVVLPAFFELQAQ